MTAAAKDVPRAKARDIARCDVCGKPALRESMGSFLRVTVQHALLDLRAARETVGLAMMFGGNAALADVFSPHRGEIMLPPELSETFTVCHACSVTVTVARLFELSQGAEGEKL